MRVFRIIQFLICGIFSIVVGCLAILAIVYPFFIIYWKWGILILWWIFLVCAPIWFVAGGLVVGCLVSASFVREIWEEGFGR